MARMLLSADGVKKSYRGRRVLNGVNLAMFSGEVLAVVGENGSGKSTFLKICAGVVQPDAGRITRRGRVGYCPQEPGLLPRLTVNEHLACFGAGLDMSADEAITRGREHLSMLGTKDYEGLSAELSGGTRQKLNLALALLGDPEVLLLDEPYQGFDHGTYVNFWDLVEWWKDDGKCVVVVTHLLAELSLADHVIDMTGGTPSPLYGDDDGRYEGDGHDRDPHQELDRS